MSVPAKLYSDRDMSDGKRLVQKFSSGELLLEHGIVQRIEFAETRCNLTIRNETPARQSVHVKVFVLNKALIEIWHQTERWMLTRLDVDQCHTVSWEFKPAMPSAVWNDAARGLEPAWIVIDSL